MDRNGMLFIYKVGNVADTYDEFQQNTGMWEQLTEAQQKYICHGMVDYIFSIYETLTEEEMMQDVLTSMHEKQV